MKRIKRAIMVLMSALMVASFSATTIEAATPRTMLTYEVRGTTPSGRVDLKALITVNDSLNEVVGSAGVTNYGWVSSVVESSIRYTSVSIAADNTYAYAAVSYETIWGKSYTEVVKFYP